MSHATYKNSECSDIEKKNLSGAKIPQNMVYASYLPQDITEEKLKSIFGEIGEIKQITIKSKMDGFTFAYITYFNEKDAATALTKLKNKKIDSNFIRVKPYLTNPQPILKKKPEQHRVKLEDQNSEEKSPHLTEILERYSRSCSPPDFGNHSPCSSIQMKDSLLEIQKKQYYKPYHSKRKSHRTYDPFQGTHMVPFPFMGSSAPIIGYIPIIYFPQFHAPSTRQPRQSRKRN